MNLRNINSRRWCFTINNPTADDDDDLHKIEDTSSYLVYQLERGEQEGTRHYQGYVEFLNRKRGSTMLRMFRRPPHLEVAKGTPAQASAYCKKDEGRLDGPFEHGTLTEITQGTRTDLDAVYKAIAHDGKSLLEISGEFPSTFMKYPRGIEKVYKLNIKSRTEKTIFIIFHGLTGTGKTRLANMFPNPYSVPKKTSTQFYDGYDPNQHNTVIFDDFKGSLEFRELLHLADEWPHQVNQKGDMMVWKPKYLIITSNYIPSDWYLRKSVDIRCWPAFQRRIDLEVQFIGNNRLCVIKDNGTMEHMPDKFNEAFDSYEHCEEQLAIVNRDVEVVGAYNQQLHLGREYIEIN